MNFLKKILHKFNPPKPTEKKSEEENYKVVDPPLSYIDYGRGEVTDYTKNLAKVIQEENKGNRYIIVMNSVVLYDKNDPQGKRKIRLSIFDNETKQTLPDPEDELFKTAARLNYQHAAYQKNLKEFIDERD